MEEQPEYRRVNEHPFVAENECFADDHRDEADIYGIANPPIETGHHKRCGRRDRGGCSKTLPYEASERFNDGNETEEDERCAHDAQRIKSEKGRLQMPIRDQPREVDRKRPRCDHEKEQGPESRPEPSHVIFPQESARERRARRGYIMGDMTANPLRL